MFGFVNNQGHTRDILLPTRYVKTMGLKNKMKQLHAILSCCYFNMFILLYEFGRIKSVFFTMQSLFMVIDLFKLLISIVMPLLV